MAEKFKRVRGTNDFYPLDKAKFNFVAERLKETVRRYGYQEVTVPSLESFRLLAAKSGEEIKQQMFTLTPKSVIKQPEEVEKEELALIPEFTPGMARMFVAKQKELVKPVKWFTFDKLWRYEAPQKGREREFYQLSVECYGSSFPEADAEVINLCIDSLKSFGLSSKDFVVKVNNRKLLSGILSDILPKAKDQKSEVIRLIDKSRKIPEETFDRLLAEQGLDAVKRERIKALVSLRGEPKKVLAKLKMTSLNAEAKEGFVELSKIISLVQDKSVELDLSVARGLAYYTGTVFEVYDKAETLRAIAGGGRYDGLVELFGGEPTPAVGFGMGYSTLSLLLDAKGLLPRKISGVDFYVASVNEKMSQKARELTQKLRLKWSAETDLLRRKLSKQLEYAASIGATKVVIVGPEELKKGKVVVRDMASGKEEEVSIDELLKYNIVKLN